MRGTNRRLWIKLYVTGMLHGSVRWQLEPDERSTWVDLLCMAGECGKEGKISDNDSLPFPRSFIANHLNISPELLERTILKCKAGNRISEENGVLNITNWKVYQSEYARQKHYRDKAKAEDPDKYIKGKYGHMVQG